MKNTILCALVFLCQWPVLLAQMESDFIATESAKKSLQHAQSLVNQGKLKAAAAQLKHTIKIKDDFAVAYRELGMVYLELELFELAIEAYETSFDLDVKLSRAAYFECGEAYLQLSNTDMAKYYYTKYKELKDKRYANKQKESGLEIDYDLILPEREANLAYINNLPADDGSGAERLDASINSRHDDFLPAITTAYDLMLFTRTEKTGNQNIFYSKGKAGEWGKAQPYGSEINTDNNEGMAKLEAHGKRFYFAGCFRPDSEGGCDIYEAVFDQQKVASTQRLEGHLNSDKWDSQPSVTCDGQKLYFTSTREGGFGGADIYVSEKNPDGTWGMPVNLGPSINTEKDEEAPYISNDGTTLYFTSTGHPGQGEGDLFISRLKGQQWTPAENMDFPFNSPGKEIGFFIHADGQTAYFSSARTGGLGGLDIYKVTLPEKFRPSPTILLEGQVVDKTNRAAVKSYIKISREDDHRYLHTDKNGSFFLCLPGNKGYSFQINEPDYDYFIDARFIASSGDLDPTKVLLELSPKTMAPQLVSNKAVKKIEEKRAQFFFETDSYSLTHEDLLELEKLAQILNKEREWNAEVVGYADQSGSKDYNKWLSEQRAQKIMAYLRAQGVANHQIVKIEGKGSDVEGGKTDTQMRRVDVVLYRK